MDAWDELLGHLAFVPRENGTPQMQATAQLLARALGEAGAQVELFEYFSHPYRLRLAGLVAFACGGLYFLLMRRRKGLAALAVSLLGPALLLLELDAYVPLFGWVGAESAQHVVGRIPAAGGAPTQRLVFTAHYDTKTDLLDHVERAPIDALALPLALLMVAGALGAVLVRRPDVRGWRWVELLRRVAGWGALVQGLAMLLVLSAGALVRPQSPGAVDNGGSCAVVVQLARALAERPLPGTEVELVLLAGEELGVHGSWHYARAKYGAAPAVPTAVVNLEGLGLSKDHAVFPRERFALRGFEPSPALVSLLDQLHRERRQKPLHVTFYGAVTDARSFLAHGVPAVTLVSDLPGHALIRGLHSEKDHRARLDREALAEAVQLLEAVARRADERRTFSGKR